MFTAAFWAQAIERALKSAAQALLIVWGASQINALSIAAWQTALTVVVSAALVSLLTSLASLPFGPGASPSLVSAPVVVVPALTSPPAPPPAPELDKPVRSTRTRSAPSRGVHEKE